MGIVLGVLMGVFICAAYYVAYSCCIILSGFNPHNRMNGLNLDKPHVSKVKYSNELPLDIDALAG